MSENPIRPRNSSPTPSTPASPPAAANGGTDEQVGRYDANLKLIRCRLADEDRTKTKRRWRLLF